MEIKNKETYTTTVLDIIVDNDEFRVIHNDAIDDIFDIPEYIIIDEIGNNLDSESFLFKDIKNKVFDYINKKIK